MPLERRWIEAEAMGAECGPDVAVASLEVGRHEVHRGRPDELRDEQVARPGVELLRDGDLLEDAVPHHGDPVAHRQRLGLVVGDVDRRHAEIALDAGDLRAHLDAQLRVEVRERLVHQERLRVADDRAPHGDSLPLPARERPWLLVQRVREAEDTCRLGHACVDLTLRQPAHLEREAHVLRRVHVRVERVVLEDHRDVAVLRRQVVDHLAVEHDLPRGDRLEPGDHPEGGRLAAARWADEDDELAGPHLEVEVGDGVRAVGIDLRKAFERDLGHVRLRT